MEENGERCDWNRGLGHAYNWNTFQRYRNHFFALATANTFQPYQQDYMWNQGRIHYTSNEMWFQPSAFIDEKIVADWLPNVVEATTSADSILDVTAKINDRKDSIALYVANLSDKPQKAVINISNFKFSKIASTWVIGDADLSALNTAENKARVAPLTTVVHSIKRTLNIHFLNIRTQIITLNNSIKKWTFNYSMMYLNIFHKKP